MMPQYLIKTYEITQAKKRNISRKPMIYLKETYEISQGNLSYMSRTHQYLQDAH